MSLLLSLLTEFLISDQGRLACRRTEVLLRPAGFCSSVTEGEFKAEVCKCRTYANVGRTSTLLTPLHFSLINLNFREKAALARANEDKIASLQETITRYEGRQARFYDLELENESLKGRYSIWRSIENDNISLTPTKNPK